MWWRAPWLEQRRDLIGLALFDALVIVGAYNGLFRQRFGHWAGITGSVTTLVLIWVILSYLLGRYSRRDTEKKGWSVGWVVVIVVAITMMAAWIGITNDPRALPDFLMPMLSITAALSALSEGCVTRRTRGKNHWLLLVSSTEKGIIEKELRQQDKIRKLQVRYCDEPTQAHALMAGDEGYRCIALGEQVSLIDEQIQAVLYQRSVGKQVVDLVSWCECHLQRVPPELLSSRWLLTAEGFQLQPGKMGWRVKRLGDLVLAGILLIITSPLLILAAGIIKLEDGGPIIYSQTRTGLYGQPFRIWKLRSMRVGSEGSGIRWAEREDPRITNIGRILRRVRVDELPQLINVIMGDMSLIGPRPERPELESKLEECIPHYRVRHWTRPGLSGWAQVCFQYGASVEDSRIKVSYDLYYLRNFSLLLDCLILIKTIRLVCTAKGALPRKQLPSGLKAS